MHEARFVKAPTTHSLKIWVEAPPEILSSIESVTYYLHPTFNPSILTVDSSKDKFAISLTAWGEFEIKAKIYFKDGQVKDLSRYLSFSSFESSLENLD